MMEAEGMILLHFPPNILSNGSKMIFKNQQARNFYVFTNGRKLLHLYLKLT